MSNLFCAIAETASALPANVAFESPDASRLRFRDLIDHSARYARTLESLGVAPGDRVLVQVQKRLQVVPLYLAVLRAGAVYLPLNTAYTDAELRYFVADAEPRVAIVEPERLAAVRTMLGAGARALTTDELDDVSRDLAPTHEVVARAPDELAAILYTSGTTGRSKGAMLTHENLESNARTLVERWGFTRDDVLLHALPIYHVHGLFVALHCALLSGARTLFHTRFDAPAVARALGAATVFMGVPTHYTRLLGERDFPLEGTTLRLWISGSAPLRIEDFEAFERRTGQRILERYGMTEAGMITSNPLDGVRIAGAVGRPLPGVSARVRNADGLVSANQPGVLEIKGPNVFVGYWRNAEKTAESFTADGWFVTGDVATIDEHGIVRLVGREKDLIISGGLNVYPKEVEDELDGLDGVRESAVIGVPHPDFGEAVVAVVDSAGAALEETAIVRALRTRLATFKVPKRVMFVTELPRNAMGKVQKKVLRERYETLFQ